ncbi:hypothetical protein J1605_000463 [Eschrichtius robustus]|uniref:Glucosamine 6-phosphate N-acetyltransferase n=1 Tax=Eschrichtius robustus TaxID=9764 RepID=A0AB34HB33_ESCRO|nr:hypothetical protein J1605_000463 [Eschrichtius robustus]
MAAARGAAALRETVAPEVEEVGLPLKPDVDLVLCTRVGENPTGLERSADCRSLRVSNRCDCYPRARRARPGPGRGEVPFGEPGIYLRQLGAYEGVEGSLEQVERTHAWSRGFFKLLGQLTETGVVNPEQFMKSFEHMKKSGDYYVTVVEDVTLGQIVATATLIIEHKFIHSCAKRGRVEDVVVSDECRGKQLGKLLLSTLTLLSKKLNCYKITLECLPQNAGFYKKFGYTVSEENYMCQRFLK